MRFDAAQVVRWTAPPPPLQGARFHAHPHPLYAQRQDVAHRGARRPAGARLSAPTRPPDRHQGGLQGGRLRRLLRPHRRAPAGRLHALPARHLVPRPAWRAARQTPRHGRGPDAAARRPQPGADRHVRAGRHPVRLLHAGLRRLDVLVHARLRRRRPQHGRAQAGHQRQPVPLHRLRLDQARQPADHRPVRRPGRLGPHLDRARPHRRARRPRAPPHLLQGRPRPPRRHPPPPPSPITPSR